MRDHLREWGPTPKEVVIARLAPLMPPGYSWQRYIIDGRLKRMVAKGEWEEGDPFPVPEDVDDFHKAQRHLVLWFLRQFRREGRLVEKNGTIAYKE